MSVKQVSEEKIKMSENIIEKIKDLTEELALEVIKQANMKSRILEKDGVNFMGSMDYKVDRVNLFLKDGKVYKATIG